MVLDTLTAPIVLAPMAGGPSTPELAAAVSDAGGLGTLAAGYLTAALVAQTRALTPRPFGVNVFLPGPPGVAADVAAYAELLRASEEPVGEPRHDDDEWSGKVDALLADPVAVITFTFGCPPPEVVARAHGVGTEVWVTVTSAADAVIAAAAGADVLVVQGSEAGGHRGGLHDGEEPPLGLLPLLQLVREEVSVPLVATGGLMTGGAVAAVLALGASGAQLGTAFLLCPEAGTTPVHRERLAGRAPTGLTRAFTGRLARGIQNGFMAAHDAHAPRGYPEVHHLTGPLRRAAREAGDGDRVNLWAGEGYPLARTLPAAELLATLLAEAGLAARGQDPFSRSPG